MKIEEIDRYLELSPPSDTYSDEIKKVIEYYSNICPECVTDIFISNKIEEGKYQFDEKVWLFSKNFAMEVKDMVSEYPGYDMSVITNNIIRVEFYITDYNLKRSTEGSYLKIKIFFKEDFSGSFYAKGKNCDLLMEIYKKFIIPNYKIT